ncbi:MAG TPA: hypothetical protein VKU92_10855 [Acidimicrobiales bacterium]|nr:hypothetical protein [Acidimicrobiales bacterium]
MFRRICAAACSGILATAIVVVTATPSLASPSGEAAYADGQVYWMHSAHVDTAPGAGQLNSPPIYILGFPVPPGTSGPITLPSGYQPQCDPCDAEPIHYHDHLLTGEPGSGTNGTAGDYRAPWRIVVMMYSPAYFNSPGFVPVTSDQQLPAAEAAGDFLVVNPGAPDPYQIWTDTVLICPIVQQD